MQQPGTRVPDRLFEHLARAGLAIRLARIAFMVMHSVQKTHASRMSRSFIEGKAARERLL